MRYDIVIVGAGIVGLASAWHIQKNHPGRKLLVIEKESGPAKHQSGHNSGVIHSGIYYTPGSLKARFAKKAGISMPAFCEEHGIPYDVCGKVVVAVEQEELARLDKLQARAAENQIPVRRLTGEELREREPHAAGIAALEVPSAGIADYPGVCRKLVELITLNGGEVRWNCPVEQVKIGSAVAQLITPSGPIETTLFVTCGGLQSDLLTAMAGVAPPAQIIPFRGEYYTLTPKARRLVNH
jgi:L-2-hydroxyglutarate oxidase